MALSIIQNPAAVSLAQSPIVFTVDESTAVVNSSSFQYVADLYYWDGEPFESGSEPDYTLVKFPNTSYVGIFDFSRIINSTLSDLAEVNRSNVKYYAADFYWQFKNNAGQFITGSHLKSATYKALDGYGIFQEPIGQQITAKSDFWPIMTDGPSQQTFIRDTTGWMTCFVGTTNGLQATRMQYTSGNLTQFYNLSGSLLSSQQTDIFPISTGCTDFPLPDNVTEFTVRPYAINAPIGAPITFKEVCNEKYPNIRIKWKNRFGQFDYLNFNMINRQGFQSTKRTYSPQLGTWEGTSLTYGNADSSTLNYISDSSQTLSVNTDYISEDYNDILKQLLVADEIYWVYGDALGGIGGFNNGYSDGFNGGIGGELVRPITIRTDSIVFKTGVVDKLIQYQFDFDWGQSYKLII
jgi:hypothetical protein